VAPANTTSTRSLFPRNPLALPLCEASVQVGRLHTYPFACKYTRTVSSVTCIPVRWPKYGAEQLGGPVRTTYAHLMGIQLDHAQQLGAPSLP
jgi:hypothetical protein